MRKAIKFWGRSKNLIYGKCWTLTEVYILLSANLVIDAVLITIYVGVFDCFECTEKSPP